MESRVFNLVFRGWKNGVLQFQEAASIDASSWDELSLLSQRHQAAVDGPDPWMLEIEFLEEPDQQKRFFRFGTDTAGMHEPYETDLANTDLLKWRG